MQAPKIKTATAGFSQWLHSEGLTLFISTYQHDCLIVLSSDGSDSLAITGYPFDRPMGIAVSATGLKLASRQHLWEFDRISPLISSGAPSIDAVYRLKGIQATGFLDAHDLVADGNGDSILVDTHHSCLRKIDHSETPTPIWSPSFITDLVPEDRCHLNGLAAEDGTPRYATIVSQSDDAEGWRRDRRSGGALLDIESNAVVAENLSMPHSPRIYRDRVWVLNAGTGEFGFVEPSNGTFNAIAFCPGFLRGLAFYNDHAIIGLSQARHNGKFKDLQLGETLDRRNEEAICGIMAVNIETHQVSHSVQFDAPITELFDVQVAQGVGHPTLLKCQAAE